MARSLWFGLALFTAFGSIYAGLFGATILQYPLVAMAIIAIVFALRTPPPPDDPRKQR
ncbi:MAG: hypothetical protein IT182_13380 [Acidobacteria bacterium]|nr:hypothetical protein [Acidobacteriota bacterium]